MVCTGQLEAQRAVVASLFRAGFGEAGWCGSRRRLGLAVCNAGLKRRVATSGLANQANNEGESQGMDGALEQGERGRYGRGGVKGAGTERDASAQGAGGWRGASLDL